MSLKSIEPLSALSTYQHNLPFPFMKTVKVLYSDAFTQVAINGELSTPFKVTRGVRQGDPLSCTLFDLAIKPLACKLRNDDLIEGISIPGLNEKIIVNMFADDRFDHIETLLKEWCEVSDMKFNIEKTEIIPIRRVEHRVTVQTSRKINPEDQSQLDTKIRIAKDKDAIHLL